MRPDSAARSNLAVSTPFEPGSVFKVVTLAAALETTDLTPDTMINCGNGIFNLFGRVIHDLTATRSSAWRDVLAKSSNIGAIQIGLKNGRANRFTNTSAQFGFGQKTGYRAAG